MILNIRGTSGAGKTHLVRRLMAAAHPDGAAMLEALALDHPVRPGKKILAGYTHYDTHSGSIFFAGSYEATCGGCDKFSWKGAADWVQALVAEQAEDAHVVFEGALVSEWKTERFCQLEHVSPLSIVVLNTPLADCLAAVTNRRAARGVAEPVDPESTTKRHETSVRKAAKERALGLDVHMLDREAAYLFCCEKLGLIPEAA